MNFVGHVVAARADSDDPEVALGAALPDLTPARRLDVEAAPPGLRRGIEHHHRADTAFHGDRRFTEAVAEVRSSLVGSGVARGPARAAAHVGVELLLDAVLLGEREGSDAFAPVWARLADPDELVLRAVVPRHRAEWSRRLHRMTTRLDPWRHVAPDELAPRVAHVLAPRARLALGGDDVATLAGALAATRATVLGWAGRLVDDVAAATRSDPASGQPVGATTTDGLADPARNGS